MFASVDGPMRDSCGSAGSSGKPLGAYMLSEYVFIYGYFIHSGHKGPPLCSGARIFSCVWQLAGSLSHWTLVYGPFEFGVTP